MSDSLHREVPGNGRTGPETDAAEVGGAAGETAGYLDRMIEATIKADKGYLAEIGDAVRTGDDSLEKTLRETMLINAGQRAGYKDVLRRLRGEPVEREGPERAASE